MRYTLLELVQDIMSDMDSDLVNSIDDTPESQQVAQILKSTYNDLLSTKTWKQNKQLLQLNAATAGMPTHCSVPIGTQEVLEIRYDSATTTDTRKLYKTIKYLYPDAFLDKINARNTDDANVEEVSDVSGVVLPIINDTAPQYWTSFDDTTVVFDSYDSAVDSFIQNSKTSCIAYKEPSWSHEDTFVPDMPAEAFSLLLAEAKSRAFLALSQEPNEKAEQQAVRSRQWLSRKDWQLRGEVRYPNYGRRGRK